MPKKKRRSSKKGSESEAEEIIIRPPSPPPGIETRGFFDKILSRQSQDLKTKEAALAEKERLLREFERSINSKRSSAEQISKKHAQKEEVLYSTGEKLRKKEAEVLQREKELLLLRKEIEAGKKGVKEETLKRERLQKHEEVLKERESKLAELESHLGRWSNEVEKKLLEHKNLSKIKMDFEEKHRAVSEREASLKEMEKKLNFKQGSIEELEKVNNKLREMLSRKEEELKRLDMELVEKEKKAEEQLKFISKVASNLKIDVRVVEEQQARLKRFKDLKSKIAVLERQEEKVTKKVMEMDEKLQTKEKYLFRKEREIRTKEKDLVYEIDVIKELEGAMLEKTGRERISEVAPITTTKTLPIFDLIDQCRGAIRLSKFEHAHGLFRQVTSAQRNLKLRDDEKRRIDLSVQELYDDLNLAMLYS